MEVSRLGFGQSCSFSGAGMDTVRYHHSASSASLSIPVRGKFSGFSDKGHLEYYNCKNKSSAIIRCGKKEGIKGKETKKIKSKLKLLKGLSRNLYAFSDMGVGLNPDQVEGNTISEAANLLLEQLEKLRAEEKELKRQRKEEKAKLKAARMQTRLECDNSSSSSSDSSDSECGEVGDMNHLKRAQAIRNALPPLEEEVESPPPSSMITQEENRTSSLPLILESAAPVTPSTPIPEEKITVGRVIESCGSCNMEQECCSRTETLSVETSNVNLGDGNALGKVASSKKIEVCMGGKCKKSGAAALLEEFQKAVGIEVGVSGCKCMGKCRDGPNVRVRNNFEGVEPCGNDVSVRSPSNPLFIGVGLDDVDLIVTNLLGENQQAEFGVAAAS